MKKLMNLSLSLALALTLCTAVAPTPTVDFGEGEVTEEEGVMPLSDMPSDTDFHF
ncbi:hypothetical protein C804_02835 [Lachnospiraceae bacterium A4]|nr:hypothetical protein C804_02835 [Lachnospiraceae bacterium A4]